MCSTCWPVLRVRKLTGPQHCRKKRGEKKTFRRPPTLSAQNDNIVAVIAYAKKVSNLKCVPSTWDVLVFRLLLLLLHYISWHSCVSKLQPGICIWLFAENIISAQCQPQCCRVELIWLPVFALASARERHSPAPLRRWLWARLTALLGSRWKQCDVPAARQAILLAECVCVCVCVCVSVHSPQKRQTGRTRRWHSNTLRHAIASAPAALHL